MAAPEVRGSLLADADCDNSGVDGAELSASAVLGAAHLNPENVLPALRQPAEAAKASPLRTKTQVMDG